MKLNKLHSYSFEDNENDETWAISYGDMVTLLLSFFVIFFSTDFKKNKQETLDKHLMSAFNMLTLEAKPSKKMDEVQKTSTSPFGKEPRFELIKNSHITKVGDQLIVTFEQISFFENGAIEPSAKSIQVLKEFARKFTPYTGLYKISVKAFTDNTPVRDGAIFKSNMELSALRAVAALRILQKSGIPLNRMEIAGYGEMDKLNSLISAEKLKLLSPAQKKQLSRTIILIIKHDNEQSLL